MTNSTADLKTRDKARGFIERLIRMPDFLDGGHKVSYENAVGSRKDDACWSQNPCWVRDVRRVTQQCDEQHTAKILVDTHSLPPCRLAQSANRIRRGGDGFLVPSPNVEVQGLYSGNALGQGATLGFIVPVNTDGSNPWEMGCRHRLMSLSRCRITENTSTTDC